MQQIHLSVEKRTKISPKVTKVSLLDRILNSPTHFFGKRPTINPFVFHQNTRQCELYSYENPTPKCHKNEQPNKTCI